MGLTFRFSKKLILIMSGIVVLGGGSGAAAVFVGADKLLGPSYLEMNGFECTSLETIKIKRDQRYWVRKYVTSEEPGDGMARIRTALRVARAVQEKEKADLVQVAMIDKAGPTDRALMRGRMIGAQVIYIPDPGKMPKGTAASVYSAYYLDGTANASGEYYGMRIDLPVEDVEAVTARLTDHADCVEPAAAVPEGAHGASADGHGAPAGGHGEPSGGHGESSGGHGEEPAAGGHDAPAEGHGDEIAAKESGGLLGSVTGMLFGSGEKAPPAEGHAKEAADHAPAPADGHGAPASDQAATEDHRDQKPGGKEAAVKEHAAEPAASKQATKADDGGFLASVKGMIFGSGGAEKPVEKVVSAPAVKAPPEQPAPEPRTAAEGGKRWSKSTDADAKRSEPTPAEAAHAEVATPPTDGSNGADAAGAAWLAKMRGETPLAPAKAETPAAGPATKPAKADEEASAKPAKTMH
ncbi:hypothetical protein [Neorhizobium alkalisoli]|uniref:hypothetical protein n=1 Tax=Neorhizobium alkalisoli TaxID=528178 RepID=UPI000CF87638|nr:hypothetical protein [Neorhizobium alkalisoli]